MPVPNLASTPRDPRTLLFVVLLVVAVTVALRPGLDNHLARDDPQTLDDIARPAFQWPLGAAVEHTGRRLWGSEPYGRNLLSLMVHAGNTLLVYALGPGLIRAAVAGRAGPRTTWQTHVAAGLAALLFGVHPLRVEAVAWAAQHDLALGRLSLLLAALLYIRSCGSTRRARWLAGSLGCYLLALAAGPEGVTLPLILLVLDWWPLGRLRLTTGRVWLEKLPYLALAAAAVAIAVVVQKPECATTSRPPTDVAERLLLSAYGAVFYLWKTLWPFDLLPLYELRQPPTVLSVKYLGSFAAVGLALIIGLALVRRAGRPRALLVGSLCYLLLIVPTTLFLADATEEAADRYSYLPGIACSLFAAGSLAWLWVQPDPGPRAVAALLVIVGLGAAGLSVVLTRQQCRVWRTPLTLWTHAVEHQPEGAAWSAITLCRLARELDVAGQHERAIQLYQSAISLRPALLEARLGLGAALLNNLAGDAAVEAYRQAVMLAPGSAEAQFRLGTTLATCGHFEQAEYHLRRAAVLAPDAVAPRSALGHLLMILGRHEDAVAEFRAALLTNPGSADLHYDLGCAYLRAGDPQRAAEAFRGALQVQPGHKLARKALEDLGRS